jgi:hypothetical protein
MGDDVGIEPQTHRIFPNGLSWPPAPDEFAADVEIGVSKEIIR